MQEENEIIEIPKPNDQILPITSPNPQPRGSAKIRTRTKLKIQNKSKTENAMISLLLDLPFTKILPSYVIQDISHLIEERIYKKSDVILRQGEPINNLYIIKSGSFIFTINHESISQVSQDINSFIRYQSITEEPFMEKRKYELTGKIKNNEQIPIFIYQKKKLFGDIEIISGKNTSLFNIYSNEDNSTLYIIDRIKWVKLTKRIRVIFTKLTLKKIEMIYDRILEVLKGKDCLNIDKMRLYKQKIFEQIEINNNYDIYYNQLEKKEKKLQNELDKYKLENKNSEKEKEKSLIIKNFRHNKDYLLNLFKYPNILKEDVRSNLNKYLFKIKSKDTQRFKLGTTISKINSNQDLSKNDSIRKNEIQNLQSNNIFVTNNSFKLIKNNSVNSIFDPIKILRKLNTRIKNKVFLGENSSLKSSTNFYKTTNSMIKLNDKSISPFVKITNSLEQSNTNLNNINEQIYSQKMKNYLLKNTINKRKVNQKLKVKQSESKDRKKTMMKNKTIRIYSEDRREKRTKEQIDYILNERYKLKKEKLIDKLFGK